jgi:prolipoprotein diacylglyceryltransferase
MWQVLIRIPIKTEWTPDGIPIYGFGAMLFVAFVVCTWLAGRRAQKEGIAKEYIQDLAIWIFVGGIAGARIVYMIQYHIPFWPITNFFRIWEGGLVFYGSAIGGVVGYFLAYIFVIRRHGLSSWKLADIIAPSCAIGLCIGRFGCLFNGCCYGGLACPDCPQMHFPLSAPARYQLVSQGYQTAAGFTMKETEDAADPRTVVDQVEPHSAAAAHGLKPGDRIIGVNGQANSILVTLEGRPEAMQRFKEQFPLRDIRPKTYQDGNLEVAKIHYQTPEEYQQDRSKLSREPFPGVRRIGPVRDVLWDMLVNDWRRGDSTLSLTVQRKVNEDGQEVEKEIVLEPFAPQTLGLNPTQLYESISMFLLFLLLMAYYPFRRHDGEVMVLFMLCYAAHRFVNEMLRNDTDPVAFGMTLSQNGSIIVFVVALLLAIWLWRRPVQYPAKTATA